ncbi:MAG: aspartyl-tRNA(Asn)/glutamyl-tRNA (Gln) amidotransferase subunit C, partial [Halothiobacillaceae bacterium]
TRAEVDKIARLAKLVVAEEDKPNYMQGLSNILSLVEQLNQVNTEGVVPMAHPFDAGQRLRADEVTEGDQRELFQSIAPAVENGLYLVPKVIE